MPTVLLCNGGGVASGAGTLALLELEDRSGMTRGLNDRLAGCWQGRSRRAPMEALGDITVMLAGGGAGGWDVEVLAGQREVWGQVASVPTAWWTSGAVASDEPAVVDAWREARSEAMW